VGHEVGALPDEDRDADTLRASLRKLEDCARALRDMERGHRRATLSSAAHGSLNPDEAIGRVEGVRRLEMLARRARKCAAHLVDPVPVTVTGEAA